jgi:hypothetical protein
MLLGIRHIRFRRGCLCPAGIRVICISRGCIRAVRSRHICLCRTLILIRVDVIISRRHGLDLILTLRPCRRRTEDAQAQ